jgi:hypothetical protein
MANANDVVYITQGELEKLVRQDARRICKPKQTVIGKGSP